MWNPISIEIVNLYACKKVFYKFKNNTCTVIFGRNLCDTGFENNGAGKSTMFDGIALALINEVLKGDDKESFINRDEESCKVVLCLRNDFLKKDLKIVREFYRGSKSVRVEVWEDGIHNKQIVSVNQANAHIITQLGVSKEDLLRYFIISQDSRYTFFTATDTEKKEIMNRITSADMLIPVIKELDKRFKEKEAVSKTIGDKLSKLTDKLEIYQEQLDELVKNDNVKSEIETLNVDIAVSREEILKESKVLETLNTELKKIDKELKLERAKLTDRTALVDKRKKIVAEINELDDKIEENEKVIKKLEKELAEEIECPNCEFHFILNPELGLSIEEIKDLKAEAEYDLLQLENKLAKKKNERDATKKKIEALDEVEVAVSKLKKDLEKKSNDIDFSEKEILDFNAFITTCQKKIVELKKTKDNSQTISLKEKIAGIEVEMKEVNAEYKIANDDLEMVKYWQFYMGKQGFTTYLANKSVKIIEGITNSYLKKFGVDLTVLINGFRILKDKTVREKIDVFVQFKGFKSETYKSKSGGEKGRVNLAGIIGIQHLINMSSDGRGLNLLILDETFPGIDTKGKENIIRILEQLGITVLMVVQNVSAGFNNENKLIVQKQGDISEYVTV